jgi:RNA polymerase sigma factor (sigma-70 family)
MFSTPGSPAQFAREIVNAFGPLLQSCSRQRNAVRRRQTCQVWLGVMTPSQTNAAAPLSLGALSDAAASAGALETAAVHQLYEKHSLSLVRQLTRNTGCRELARELVQETFLRLLRMAPGSLGRIDQPEAYLRQVSTNLLRDWGRARTLKERSQPTLELTADEEVDQIAVLESRDTLRRLERAMSKLKPKTREIFLAHRIHGFTYAEIAVRTGLSVKGVEKQMAKAIAKIDRFLDRA